MHDDNCFITLTYDDDHLPWDGSLQKHHFQNFLKRLRWHNRHKSIRYFMCGEYGDGGEGKPGRPHYHAILFNHDFGDKTLWAERDGIPTWVSDELSRLWPFGFSTVGRCTWQTAAYVARYTTKKKTGDAAKTHYWRLLTTDLEIEIEPEYANMSLKPAIGKTWFDTYPGDCYPSDYVTHNGKKFRVPRYYDKLLDQADPGELARLKRIRVEKARERHAENTGKRLRDREKVTLAKLKSLNRQLG